MRRYALVCGAGGFIGSHLVKRLKDEGYYVFGADLKYPDFDRSYADQFERADLRDPRRCNEVVARRFWMEQPFDEVFQLAAEMGGAGFVFTGENDADIIHNSAMINLNIADACVKHKVNKVFYSSSACIYPQENQEDPNNPNCVESSAYPANPDSDYGLEKIFSERLYTAFYRNYGLNIRIARLHNIFGEDGCWEGGREKAPAALCRKVIQADEGGAIEVWGDGTQTRSFLYIDECLEGIRRLMGSNYREPVNIGSEEMISINDLAKMIIGISGKELAIRNITGPEGVKGRNSDNKLIYEVLGWKPSKSLFDGLVTTYKWIESKMR